MSCLGNVSACASRAVNVTRAVTAIATHFVANFLSAAAKLKTDSSSDALELLLLLFNSYHGLYAMHSTVRACVWNTSR